MSSDYDVGYGKPPKQHRFQKGNKAAKKRGGTGKGKRKAVSIPEVLERVLRTKRGVRRGDRTIEMNMAELLVERLIQMIASGSSRDLLNVMALIERFLPETLSMESNTLEIIHTRAEGSKVPLPDASLFKRDER